MKRKDDVRIEYPSRGATYCRQVYGVYKYDVYPKHSVLAGQQRRIFIDRFETLDAARKAYPDARVMAEGNTGFQKPSLDHLPCEHVESGPCAICDREWN